MWAKCLWRNAEEESPDKNRTWTCGFSCGEKLDLGVWKEMRQNPKGDYEPEAWMNDSDYYGHQSCGPSEMQNMAFAACKLWGPTARLILGSSASWLNDLGKTTSPCYLPCFIPKMDVS